MSQRARFLVAVLTTSAGVVSIGSVAFGAIFAAGATATTASQPHEPSSAVGAHPDRAGAAVQSDFLDPPGEAHMMLARLAGDWTTSAVVQIAGEEAGPAETGTAHVESILDRCFITINETGTLMGEPFSALKVFGYNNAAQLFEATWVYTGSTATMRARGIIEPDSGVLTFQAQYASGPESSERFIITLWSPHPEAEAPSAPPEQFTLALISLTAEGTAGATLETTYTRVHEHVPR